jgi:hypothetical protein
MSDFSFNLVPKRSNKPPPTRKQIAIQALLAVLALLVGAAWASHLGAGPQRDQVSAALSALLIISGLCGAIVSAIQYSVGRK